MTFCDTAVGIGASFRIHLLTGTNAQTDVEVGIFV